MAHQGVEPPVRYWPPDPRLRGMITGYHRYRLAAPPGMVAHDALFPSWATIRISLAGSEAWSLRVGPRRYDPVPAAAFAGPASYAGYCGATRGTLVGMGILPTGWKPLFGGDISRFTNRVVPLSEIVPDADRLAAELSEATDPAPVFDRWLLARLGDGRPDPEVERILHLIDEPSCTQSGAVAEAMGLSPRALALRMRGSFGFTPKILLRRNRFLRALAATLADPARGPEVLEDAGYWDRSHFLRDSNLFLGCSVTEFRRRRGALNALALKARADALGSPV